MLYRKHLIANERYWNNMKRDGHTLQVVTVEAVKVDQFSLGGGYESAEDSNSSDH